MYEDRLASKGQIMSMTRGELSRYLEDERGGCANWDDTLSDLRQCALEEINYKLFKGRYVKMFEVKQSGDINIPSIAFIKSRLVNPNIKMCDLLPSGWEPLTKTEEVPRHWDDEKDCNYYTMKVKRKM